MDTANYVLGSNDKLRYDIWRIFSIYGISIVALGLLFLIIFGGISLKTPFLNISVTPQFFTLLRSCFDEISVTEVCKLDIKVRFEKWTRAKSDAETGGVRVIANDRDTYGVFPS